MNRVTLSACLVVIVAATAPDADGFPLPHSPTPRTFQTNPQHADNAIIEALIFLETKVDEADWPLYQFFEFLASSDDDLLDDVTNFRAYLPMVSTGPVVVKPIPIDKAARVWAVRLG
jgi:hypothetical protein